VLRRGRQAERTQKDDAPDDGQDNLFEPMRGPGESTGRWDEEAMPSSMYTSMIETHRARAAVVGAVALAGLLALRRR
jgi:hypothetical protein